MITNLRQQRSALTAAAQAPIRGRPSSIPGIRDATVESTRDELTLKTPMLQAEVLELRQSLPK
jgi:hypothetical protein